MSWFNDFEQRSFEVNGATINARVSKTVLGALPKPALLLPAPRQLAPESFGALRDASGSNPLIPPSASPIPCWFAGRHRPR